MPEPSRRRWAALVVGAGVGLGFISIVAEGIGLGSGQGIFGTWTKTGVVIGLYVIVVGAVLYSPQSSPVRVVAVLGVVYGLSFPLGDMVRAPALSWWHSAIFGALVVFLIRVATATGASKPSSRPEAEGRAIRRPSRSWSRRSWALAAAAGVSAVWMTVALNGPVCPECQDPYRPESYSCGSEWNPAGDFTGLGCEV